MPCIHIIEDDRDLLDLLRYQLLSHGFEVCDDFNGDLFSNNFDSHSDLYLVDVNLNDRSGTAICEQIRQRHLKPVILMSANEHLPAMAGMCGADAFIHKPFHFEELLMQVDKFILPSSLVSKDK